MQIDVRLKPASKKYNINARDTINRSVMYILRFSAASR
jgi:hypothetical protein